MQSCQNDLNLPVPASRNYEQDAEVLNRFVEINKTTHGFYINPNKRTTALSYITNADAEELAAVNSLNLDMFKQSVGRISGLAESFAANQGVDYVVMMTGDEVYVSRIKNDSPITLEKVNDTETTRNNHSGTVSLKLAAKGEKHTVYGSGEVETAVELAPQAYKNAGWAFLVSCEMKCNGNRQMTNVLFCGVGCRMLTPRFMWHADRPDTEWNFEAASCCDSGNSSIGDLKITH